MIGNDAAADRAAVAVIRASLPGRASSTLIRLMQRAWTYSQTRHLAVALASQPAGARVRRLAVMTATAGLVALVLSRLASPIGPYVWIAPAMVLTFSIVVLASQAASR